MRFWEIKEDILNDLKKFKVSLLLRLNNLGHYPQGRHSISNDRFLSSGTLQQNTAYSSNPAALPHTSYNERSSTSGGALSWTYQPQQFSLAGVVKLGRTSVIINGFFYWM